LINLTYNYPFYDILYRHIAEIFSFDTKYFSQAMIMTTISNTMPKDDLRINEKRWRRKRLFRRPRRYTASHIFAILLILATAALVAW